ncbi:MAG TPA: sn-glycerol-3-phosphate ABC transporter ATP-binding protein UgpC [Polyangiaceae bacterium]|nr:sn-glycerol-3-phosphate ABC transporter ATP-binding protein UgpC [Polyangiaceae bacterium]
METSEEVPRAARPVRCEARGVKKAFAGNPILRGVDVVIPEGGFSVLVGPSGCGKSTLLRLVAGLEEADEGQIFIKGKDVTRAAPRDRDIAMVFQSYALYPHLSVRDNLAFGLTLRNTPRAEIDQRIREASDMLGLEKLLDRLPKQLSGGQRQRVAMGRAIVRRANVYLFDEPLSNLDAALRAEVRVDIRRLHDRLGATSLYVTHDQVEAMTLADTLWVLNGGLVEQSGPPLEVYEKPKSVFVATFLGSPPMNLFEGALTADGGEVFVEGQGVRVRADASRHTQLTPGRKVKFGVRPHDLVVAGEGRAAVGELHVELVEALGFEAYAYGWVTSAGPRVIARLAPEHARRAKVGDVIPVAAELERLHLFDAETGRALP